MLPKTRFKKKGAQALIVANKRQKKKSVRGIQFLLTINVSLSGVRLLALSLVKKKLSSI